MAKIRRDIIDNISEGITMSKILNSEIPYTQKLDISTGYFNIGGYSQLKEALYYASLKEDFEMRLLLGKEALIQDASFEEIAKNDKDSVSIKSELNDAELTPESMSDTASLIKFLNKSNISVRLGQSNFNHSKCYITDDVAFIGSSNFTAGGLYKNDELNAGLYQPGITGKTLVWFNKMWDKADDTKQDLIKLLESSKFGEPATPYDIYIKMIFEKYRDILAPDEKEQQYNIKLTIFQKDAVHTAMFILSEFQGAIIADATGLGKTNMGMEILRQKILKENRKVLLIAPSQVLKSMWDKKLREAGLSVHKQISMELLGHDESIKNYHEYKNIDFVLIDESQNFRSKNANRSINLIKIMTLGRRKQVLLLSATPINNTIMDLYNQLSIITRKNDSYFWRSIGIPDLYKHMRDAANKDGGLAAGLDKIQRLLDGIMVRRTRSYIKEVYPNDIINNQQIKFPDREYSPILYSLADIYGNVFQKMVTDIEKLTMAPYGLERYNTSLSEKEKDKHRVLAHLQVTLLLKRFESSVEAVKISIDNKIRLYEHVQNMAIVDKMVSVKDLNAIIRKGNYIENKTDSKDESDNDFDMDEYMLTEIQKIETEDVSKEYDMEQFKEDLLKDLEILKELHIEISKVTIDKKLEAVRDCIQKDKALETESCKVLIFTEYTATAKYLLREITSLFPDKNVKCITGGTKFKTRNKYIELFAPDSNLMEDQILEEEEIDILISTEVLAEGQNLQDCNYVINYDLPWNPMRIVQRIGRVDRLANKYDVIHSRACYPDKELDEILKLMGKLLNKIKTVDDTIGLDAEILGETPTPRQYNGHLKDRLKKLGSKSDTATGIIYQMERDADLMPQNTPLNEISKRAKEIGIDELKAMSMGRRGGKVGSEKRCVLAYVREKPERYVYFVVYNFKKAIAYVPENEYDAVNEVKCFPEEPSYLPMDESDNIASFKQLLRIDKKAREAIKTNDDKIKTNAKITNRSYETTRKSIKQIIGNAYNTGKADAERLEKTIEIIDRVELQVWENDLKNIKLRYEDSKDIAMFLDGLEEIGKKVGIDKEPVNIDGEIDYTNMKLIGAMFITSDKVEKKVGLDVHV